MKSPKKVRERKARIGDHVNKVRGYRFPSTVVSVFKTTKGETRVVAEMKGYGLLHIFAPEQLKIIRTKKKK